MLQRLHIVLLTGVMTACAVESPELETETRQQKIAAYCSANVIGVGWIDTETNYLPRVVRCENGGAPLEALKAQAVAARTYLYYKMDLAGAIGDGQHDQVYSCGVAPSAIHYQAVQETAGQVLRYGGVTIAAFYVAGAIPSQGDCVARSWDSDPTHTEHYVTYNWGRSGSGIIQTTLGWVNPGNYYNRGCKSQNGARCLSNHGWGYQDILKFYYGMDIVLHQATGSCVVPPQCSPGQVQTQSCNACGTRSRTCNASGYWGSWSACTGSGQVQTQSCPECGTRSRTCNASGNWSAWSACGGAAPRPCSRSNSWGTCTGTQSCSSAGYWSACSARTPSAEVCDGVDNDCDGPVDEWVCHRAQLVGHSVPSAIEGCQEREVTITLRNSGTSIWRDADGFRLVLLSGSGLTAPASLALPRDVQPGETVEFVLTLTAGSEPGVYTLRWQMQRQGAGFGDIVDAAVTVLTPPFRAELLDASYPLILGPGEEARAYLVFLNSGEEVWRTGDVMLGTRPAGRPGALWTEAWPAYDVAATLQRDVVPGETVRLEFPVRAPEPSGEITEILEIQDRAGHRFVCGTEPAVLSLRVLPPPRSPGTPPPASEPGADSASPDERGCRTAGGQPAGVPLVILCLALLWLRRAH